MGKKIPQNLVCHLSNQIPPEDQNSLFIHYQRPVCTLHFIKHWGLRGEHFIQVLVFEDLETDK